MNSINKITLLITSLDGGGAEGVSITLANKFADSGWKVDFIVLNLDNALLIDRLSKNVNLVLLNVKHSRYASIPLLKYLQKNKTNTVLTFNHELSVILVILRIIFRLKLKIISRNISILSIKIKKLQSESLWTKFIVAPMIKYFYQRIDHVVNQCNSMHEDLISIFPKLTNKSCIIYNPVSTHIFDYVNQNDLTKIKKKNYLLCVGRLEPVKALHYAIESFAKLTNDFPDLRLKIIGKGSLEKKLKQKAIDCSVSNKIDFEGFQKNIIPYYLYAKATIQTSEYEGYPNVLIESIALNTPVIAFDCPGGTKEIIKEGLNGYLVINKSTEDLKKKLSMIMFNKIKFYDMKNSIDKNKLDKVFNSYKKLLSL